MKKGVGFFAVVGLLSVALLTGGFFDARAQKRGPATKQTSKVYCWQENGMTKCGNIPASQAREINTRTGISTPISSPTSSTPLQNPHQPSDQTIIQNTPPPMSLMVQSLVANYPEEKDLVDHFNEKIVELKSRRDVLGKEHKKQHKGLVKVLQRVAEKELKEHVINDKDKEAVSNMRQSVMELRQSMKDVEQEIQHREKENASLLIQYRQAKTLGQ